MMSRHDVLLIENPARTNGEQSRHIADVLRDSPYVKQIAHLETLGPDYDQNVEHIAAHVEPGMTVVSVGGDGSANLAGNAIILAAAAHEEISQTTHLLAIAAGRANDYALSVSGDNLRQDRFLRALRDGQPMPATTIRTDWKHDATTHTRDALAYIGIGATGAVAQYYCDSDYRSARPAHPWLDDIRDTWTVAKTFARHEAFRVQQDGREAVVQERIWATAPRFAKYARWQVDVRSPEVLSAEFPARHFVRHLLGQVALRGAGGGLLQTGMRGQPLQQPMHLHIPQQERTAPLFAQLDGEVLAVPLDTTVTVSRRRQAFNMLLLAE